MNGKATVSRTAQELVGRLTPTPLAVDVAVMDRAIRLETNSEAVLKQIRRAFEECSAATAGNAQFTWKLVVDSGAGLKPPWPMITAFSGQGLRCANLGQRSFLGVDLEARLAVGFLAEELVFDEKGFSSLVLRTLFVMTADVIGLTPLPAACVAWNQRALLVFAEPETEGRSLSTPGERETEGQAGFVTFLEFAQDGLCAWEGFWQLDGRTQCLEGLLGVSGDYTFGAERRSARSLILRKTTPLACVFLDRVGQDTTQLIRLDQEAAVKRLRPIWVMEKGHFPNRRRALRMLGSLPAYCIKGGNELGAIAALCQDLLSNWEEHTPP